MAYLYIDDGYPESQDYENNYIYFNANDPDCVKKMMKLVQMLSTLSPRRKKILLDKIRLEKQALPLV